MIFKLIFLDNDSGSILSLPFQKARKSITGLVYHAVTPVVCSAFAASLLGAELYTYMHEAKMNGPSRILSVSFLDIGQGDSSLIQFPGGQSLIIDGGPSQGPVLSEIGASMPFYKRHIDLMIATHPDSDHIGGLASVIDRYSPKLILISGVHSNTWTDQSLQKMIDQKGVRALRARTGMTISFDSQNKTKVKSAENGDENKKQNTVPELKILFPNRDVDSWINKTNDASIVARLSFGSTSFMFTGDSPIDIEHYLFTTGALVHTDVLKAGHHGSRTSTSDEYVKAVTPTYAVISVGKNNRYGHPNQEVLDILKSNDVKIFRTDEDGRVDIESDGKEIKVR